MELDSGLYSPPAESVRLDSLKDGGPGGAIRKMTTVSLTCAYSTGSQRFTDTL